LEVPQARAHGQKIDILEGAAPSATSKNRAKTDPDIKLILIQTTSPSYIKFE